MSSSAVVCRLSDADLGRCQLVVKVSGRSVQDLVPHLDPRRGSFAPDVSRRAEFLVEVFGLRPWDYSAAGISGVSDTAGGETRPTRVAIRSATSSGALKSSSAWTLT